MLIAQADRQWHVNLSLIAAAFAVAAMMGLAILVNSDKTVSVRAILGSTLYSGMTGLTVAMLGHNYFAESNAYLLLAMSALAGSAGARVLDVLVAAVLKVLEAIMRGDKK